jgi:hypothetical protein
MYRACRPAGLTLLIAAVILPSTAFAADIKAQTGPGANFARYRTYKWYPPKVLTKAGVVEDHPSNPVLQELVDRELAKVGLKQTSDAADLMVQTLVLTESTPQLEAVLMSLGNSWSYPGETIATMGRYNRKGTLYLNLIDTETKKSAWSAKVTDSLPEKALSSDKLRSKLADAAEKMFKKYPAQR